MLILQGCALDSALLAKLRCAPFGMTREVDYRIPTLVSAKGVGARHVVPLRAVLRYRFVVYSL